MIEETAEAGQATGRARRLAWAAFGVLVALIAGSAALAPQTRAAVGDLTQRPGFEGCISNQPNSGCTTGTAARVPRSVTVSPDGRNLYSAASPDALALFDRNPLTGALSEKPAPDTCIVDEQSVPSAPDCTEGKLLDRAETVVLSANGRSAYVSSDFGLAVFDRDPASGALTQKGGAAGCISDLVTPDCNDGTALSGAREAAVSPDGENVYVAARKDYGAVAVLDRDIAGVLTQKPGQDGCVSQIGVPSPCAVGAAIAAPSSVAVSPDGENVYATSGVSDSVSVFDRDPASGALNQKPGAAGCISEDGTSGPPNSTPGACADGVALDGAFSVAVSPDGRSVYVASAISNAVAVFDRDLATGALTQKAGNARCVSETSSGGACRDGRGLERPYSIAVAPDGKSAYAASFESDAVAIFDRDQATGALTQRPGNSGCLAETPAGGACTDGRALDGAVSVTVSPDGRSVYAASAGSSAIAVFDRETDNRVSGNAKARKTQKQKRRKIVVKVRVRAGEDITARGGGRVRVGRRAYGLRVQRKNVASGKKRTLKLRPKKARNSKRIARALKRGRKATAKLKVRLSDGSGNSKNVRLKVRLIG
jgi:DNA-binding beta-propeller fold protein YncE